MPNNFSYFSICKIFSRWTWTPYITKIKTEKSPCFNSLEKSGTDRQCTRRGLLAFKPASRCHSVLGRRRKLTATTSNRVSSYFLNVLRLFILFHKWQFCQPKGHYECSKCTYPLFSSSSKYEHSSPWPAFTKTVEKDSLHKVEEARQKGALKVWFYFVIWSDLRTSFL